MISIYCTYTKNTNGNTIVTNNSQISINALPYTLYSNYNLDKGRQVWLGIKSDTSIDTIVYTWNYQ